jgi:hypothetical protein
MIFDPFDPAWAHFSKDENQVKNHAVNKLPRIRPECKRFSNKKLFFPVAKIGMGGQRGG